MEEPENVRARDKERKGDDRGTGEYGRLGNSFCPRYANISASIDTLRLPPNYVTARKNVPYSHPLFPG